MREVLKLSFANDNDCAGTGVHHLAGTNYGARPTYPKMNVICEPTQANLMAYRDQLRDMALEMLGTEYHDHATAALYLEDWIQDMMEGDYD